MPEAWSRKRERQYQHIKEGRLDKGVPEDEAEEIAARTVNKTRAQEGESEEASRTSVEDTSPCRARWEALRTPERRVAPRSSSTRTRSVRASRGGPR